MKRSRNIIARIISLFLIITLAFSILPTTITYALEDNSNSNDNGSSSTRAGGYSRRKTAYLCYIVKKDGTKATILTTPKVISIGANGDNNGLSQSFYNSTDHSYCTPKLGNKSVQLFTNPQNGQDFHWDIANPMNGDGEGQSEKIIEWMKSKSYSGKKDGVANIYYLIYALWDSNYDNIGEATNDPKSDLYKFKHSDDQYLIMEAVYWMKDNDGSNGKVRIATANGWLKLSKVVSVPENTVKNRFPVYITFKKIQFGLKACPSPHSLSTDALIDNYATGMISIWNRDPGIGLPPGQLLKQITSRPQSTCNESEITKPHAASNESPNYVEEITLDHTGKILEVEIGRAKHNEHTIVKTYVTKTEYVDKNGKVIEGLETYKVDEAFETIKNVMSYIYIEDETKESAIKNAERVPLTKLVYDPDTKNWEWANDVEEFINKTLDKVNSKKAKDCYSLEHWFVTPGKALKASTIEEGVLKLGGNGTQYSKLLKDSGKTVIKSGTKESYEDLAALKDSNGKKGKVLYVLLTKTVQKPYYQSTCDEDYVEKNENNLDKLPHAAPDESNSGKCTIVKTYITKTVNKDTNGVEIGATYKVDKDYLIKNDSISKIDIESETVGGKGVYKLAKYIVTSGKVIPKEKFEPIKSDGSGTQFRYNIETQNGKNIVCTGDTPGTITLDKHEKNGAKGKILYVYLMREIELVNTTKNET